MYTNQITKMANVAFSSESKISKNICVDFGIICRLCLCEEAAFLKFSSNIISDEGIENGHIKDYIMKLSPVTGVQIDEDDVLPHWICTTCADKLRSVITFIDMCRKSQNILQESLDELFNDYDVAVATTQQDIESESSNSTEILQKLESVEAVEELEEILEEDDKEESNADFFCLAPNEELPTCADCSIGFTSELHLRNHRTSVHHDDLVITSRSSTKNVLNDTQEEGVSCKYCDMHYLKKDWLLHYSTVHLVARRKLTDKESFECSVCLRPFMRLYSLRSHMNKHHPEISSKESIEWCCTECNFICDTENALGEHYESHGVFSYDPVVTQRNQSVQQTCHCDVKLKNSENSLDDRLHEIFFHRDRYLESGCPGCDLSFGTIHEILTHLMSHHSFLRGGTENTCAFCGNTCLSLKTLALHLGKKHNILVSDAPLSAAKTWKCAQKDCDVTLSAEELLAHGRSEHGILALYHCETCDCCFEDEKDLTSHTCSGKVEPADEDVEASFQCPKCPKDFPTKMKLHKHYSQVHMDVTGRFVCSFCGLHLRGSVALRSHEDRLHRGIRRFPCSHCSMAFSTTSILRNHQKQHMPERPTLKCETCDRQFMSASGYSRHIVSHGGQRNFVCSATTCGKAFYTKQELRRHIIIHRQDFHHACHICGHKFLTPSELRKHLTKHSGERPFECHICSAKYSRKDDKVKHMKRVHNLRTKRVYGPSSGEEVYIQEGDAIQPQDDSFLLEGVI